MKSGTGQRPCRILSPPVKRAFTGSKRTFGGNEGDGCIRGDVSAPVKHGAQGSHPSPPLLTHTLQPHRGDTMYPSNSTRLRPPVKQFKNVTLAESSCNLKMLPVAAGAVGMWESGVLFLAGFPSAEGSVGNSSWFLEFSTLSSAPHFHSA